MSWDVIVRRINHIKKHPNADNLSIGFLGQVQVILPKDQYHVGDLVSFFPQDSIIPDKWLEEFGLLGKLSGSGKNRVKPVKLRGELSLGVVTSAPEGYVEGDVVTDYYGAIRWELPIPTELSGKVTKMPPTFQKYDIENIDTFNHFIEDEMVCVYEKVHGSNMAVGLIDGELFVCSRGRSLVEDENNTYWRALRNDGLEEAIRGIHFTLYGRETGSADTLWLHGEVVPCQDLKYGHNEPTFLLFDIRDSLRFLPMDLVESLCTGYNISTVPFYARTPFSYESIKEMSKGNECVSGRELHIREGVVVRPIDERSDRRGRRVIAKFVNEEYLLRKGNRTEFH